jgi:CIC family chloride channel protein
VDIRFQAAGRLVKATRRFFREHWPRLLRIRERLRISEETFHLVLAGLVGVIGGFVNLIFYYLVRWTTTLTLGAPGELVEIAREMNYWQRLLVPGFGGMVAGLILYLGLRLAGPQGSSHIVEVVVAGDGRLRFRSALVKAISSVISISTGASIGREGAITQLTATLASKTGQLAGWQPYRLRLLVACGAASGIAATYNAPVAGAVFAAQIVLGNFAMNLFAPLVFASVVSTMVSRSFFGLEPLYKVPAFDFTSIYQLPWFLVLGILAGALGALFLKMLRYAEDRFQRLRWPIYDRLALGGLAVGALAIVFPEVWGNGFSVTNAILHGQYQGMIFALLGVFVAKLLATALSVGSGAIGGVFTPTLFLGAGLGSSLGTTLHHFGIAETLPVAAFALVGMGSVLAATVHSPLLSLIMMLEVSLNYSLMPALMLGCVTATLVARRLHSESIYIEPLRRKGVEVERESQQIGAATSKIVGEVMREPVQPMRETASFREIAERFLTSSNNFLPVVDADTRLLGVVALQDMKEYLNSGLEFHSVIAYDVMRPPPKCLTPNQRLTDVLPVLLASEQRNVPVVNNLSEFKLIGAVVRADALGLLSEAISARTTANV